MLQSNFDKQQAMLIKKISKICRYSTSLEKLKYFTQIELKQMIAKPNELRDLMIEQINHFGQLKINHYWKQALTDEKYGYYRHKNVFSSQGDFTTSPEISSLFGEMIATWLAVFMQTPKVNIINPSTNAVQKNFRIVEMGPGRGLLMQDILKSFKDYNINNHFDLCLVEISQYNRKEQQQNVMDELKKSKMYFKFDYEKATPNIQEFSSESEFKEVNLKWYSTLEDLLNQDYQNKKKGKELPFTIFIMNEFFDALPVTILEYTELGWREKVLKLSQNPQFKFELTNSIHAPPQKLIPLVVEPKIGDTIEISPESLIAMDMMAKMIMITGGGILNIDYGGLGPYSDSIRAIKQHKYIKTPYYWEIPGMCDLSAYVGFNALAQYAEKVEGIKAFDLIPQQFFLQAMGIDMRVEMISKTASNSQTERLMGQLKRLTDPSEMGQIYKVQMITLKQYGQIYPHITVNPNVF